MMKRVMQNVKKDPKALYKMKNSISESINTLDGIIS